MIKGGVLISGVSGVVMYTFHFRDQCSIFGLIITIFWFFRKRGEVRHILYVRSREGGIDFGGWKIPVFPLSNYSPDNTFV
jgi:hypothetical protein